MSHQLNTYKMNTGTYSVFVGRIPPNTKKDELRDLFQGCGPIVDVVILENGSTGHNFGFVRFPNKESALCAVSELNHWPLNGRNIIVALEKSTAAKLEKEKVCIPVTEDSGPRKRHAPKPGERPSLGTNYITDMMYWTRLQESCTALNLEQSHDKHLSVKRLANDIYKMKDDRCSALWGSVDDASTSFTEISSKIMQRCQTKGDGDEILGKKSCVEFMSALRTIMKEIDGVLGTTEPANHIESMDGKDSEEIHQLTLEGNLVREFNLELDKESEMMHNKVVMEEDKLQTTVERSVPKRLSDASVQTAAEAGHNTADLKQTYHLSDTEYDVSGHLTDKQITEARLDAGGAGGRETDMSNLDPAIIDYHLSQLKEIEHRERKRENELRGKTGAQVDIVKELYAKMELEKCFVGNDLERSNSRDSSLSDGSNEGNVDDSGVESDCFGVSKGRRSLGVVEHMLGVNGGYRETRHETVTLPGVGYRRRVLHGATSEPNLGQLLEQYVMKNKGRGMSLLETETEGKGIPRQNILGMTERQDNVGFAVKETNKVGLGRGMFRTLISLKYPIGRGHHT